MPRETSQVILGPLVAEVVEEKERIEVGRVAEAERAAQVHARALDGRLRLDEPLNGSKGHVSLQYRQSTTLNAARGISASELISSGFS
jgi:hypothetical protein